MMKNLMRTLTLSAAALAALVAAPQSDAQQFRRGETHESFRGSPGSGNHGNPSYGNRSYGDRNYGDRNYGNRSYGNRGYGGYDRGYGGYDRGYGGYNRSYGGYNRGFVRPPAFYGRHYVSPFRVYAGSRFYSYCPGPDYIYVDDLGWVFPPFVGAVWVPRFDRFGIRIGGFWR